jgi:hypothetical protein
MTTSRTTGLGRAAAVALLAAAASSAWARPAAAFCRTSSCPNVGTSQVCTPQGPGDCGVALFWASPCVGWSLQKDASAKTTFAQTEAIVTKAFHTWTTAACAGGGTPHMSVVEAAAATCALHEYNQNAGNANIILFHDTKWPYEGSPNTLALTTVTYNLDTGEIYDADMELNSADNQFTITDTGVEFDLLSIITHETGHFLGLAHSPDVDATMYPAYTPQTIKLRDLSPDDVTGICAVYPPGDAIPSSCDTTPRHGFSTLCAAEQPAGTGSTTGGGGGCAVTAPGPSPGSAPGGWAGLAAAMGALLFAARRARGAGKPRRDG